MTEYHGEKISEIKIPIVKVNIAILKMMDHAAMIKYGALPPTCMATLPYMV